LVLFRRSNGCKAALHIAAVFACRALLRRRGVSGRPAWVRADTGAGRCVVVRGDEVVARGSNRTNRSRNVRTLALLLAAHAPPAEGAVPC